MLEGSLFCMRFYHQFLSTFRWALEILFSSGNCCKQLGGNLFYLDLIVTFYFLFMVKTQNQANTIFHNPFVPQGIFLLTETQILSNFLGTIPNGECESIVE